jgi:glucose-1-phosphate cytidylyltransferase
MTTLAKADLDWPAWKRESPPADSDDDAIREEWVQWVRGNRLMKVAILAGGQGLRLAEETQTKSKAMVAIGDDPILWPIMKYYGHYGFHQFVIALGYQGDSIRDHFAAMAARRPPSVKGEQMTCFPEAEPDWTVELIDTGLDTMSGGRIKRLSPYLGTAPFMLTWCDGLSDIDLNRLRAFHERHGRIGTLSAVRSSRSARRSRMRTSGSMAPFSSSMPASSTISMATPPSSNASLSSASPLTAS